jgi:hypothetical protein
MRFLTLLVGLAVLSAAAYVILPHEIFGFGLGWWHDVKAFVRGTLPVVAILIGLSMVFFGIAEIVRKPGKRAAVNI